MGFSSKNTGVSCPALLQGIFPTQGSNPGAGRVFTIWATRKALSMLNVYHSHVEDGTVFVLLGEKEAWSCLVTCRRAWWARAKPEYASSLRSIWLQRAVSHLLCLAAASLKPSPAWGPAGLCSSLLYFIFLVRLNFCLLLASLPLLPRDGDSFLASLPYSSSHFCILNLGTLSDSPLSRLSWGSYLWLKLEEPTFYRKL